MKKIPLKYVYFIIPVIILLIIQVPHLGLPYFFDEAWSYFPSIKKMAALGPSLFPGVLPIDDCKGHPQLFFFVSAEWMRIFPDNIPMMRILPLLFSIGVLGVVYFELLKLANWETAVIASLLISVQSMFLAQSIFLLPEMLMTFFFVLSFFFFLRSRFTAYAITSSLMVLTKETSIIFPVVFGVFYLLTLLAPSNREKFRHRYLLALIIPGIIYVAFLILHYRKFGVVFYGEHLDYISMDWPTIHDKINRAYSFIFIGYGRRCISIAAIAALILWLYQRPKNGRLIILGILSFLAFMIFSVFNFYTQRYGLVAMVLFIILFSYLLGQLRITTFAKGGIAVSLAAICLYFSLTEKQNADIDLGYVETIKVHQELVQFCEENNLYDQPISATFNMIFCLRDKDLGYVTGNKSFSKIMDWKQYMQCHYFIYEATMGDPPPGVEYAKENFKLVKTLTNKHAWGYIYENTQFQQQVDQVIP
ncbi:MAG TPA: hypothetical protein DCL77_06830 [Prolixibacteraceae bacterium]|jgi:hypothetical protein|nr:hypothetical protein [Prolixibacteraceae bacterium]